MSIDQLENYGLERMDEDAISGFLAAQKTGVLGLPGDRSPYMIPLSYAFDGEDRLYFTYLLGPDSEKAQLTADAEYARFLVYSIETMFNWQSAMLEGTLTAVPESEWGDIDHLLDNVWRPEILRTAAMDGGIEVYAFDIESQAGIRHTGLAPGFREGVDREHGTNDS